MSLTRLFASQQLNPHLNPSHGGRCTQIDLVGLKSSGAGIKNDSMRQLDTAFDHHVVGIPLHGCFGYLRLVHLSCLQADISCVEMSG